MSAYNSLPATGGVVEVDGSYPMGGSFIWSKPGALKGNGSSASIIEATAGQGITIGIDDFSCCGVAVKYPSPHTSGFTFWLRKNGARFHDLTLYNPAIGILVFDTDTNAVGHCQITNCAIRNASVAAIKVRNSIDLECTNVYCQSVLGDTGVGLLFENWVEGCTFTQTNFLGNRHPFLANPNVEQVHGQCASFNMFNQCYFDSGASQCMLIGGLQNTFNSCWFSNGRINNCQGLAVLRSSATTVTNNQFTNCGTNGFYAEQSPFTIATGNMATNNCVSSSGHYPGLLSGCTNSIMANNIATTFSGNVGTQVLGWTML